MKSLIIILSLVMLISLTSAVPQIVNTQFNLTINSTTVANTTTGNYDIFGEGGHLNNNFAVVGNCNFSYSISNIPLIFSRDILQNDTDVATLIHALAINNNITYQWQQCIINLSVCQDDVGYKGNYTQAKNDLDICYRARDDYSKQVSTLNSTVSTLTTWRNMGVILGIAGIGAAIWLYRKQQVKVMTNPYNAVSGVAKQY